MSIYPIMTSFIEGRMIDECFITRDQQGNEDDTLDETTGQLIRPVNDAETVYFGKCMVQYISSRDELFDRGHEPVFRNVHELIIPHDIDGVRLGDRVEITTATNDEDLEGIVFRVAEIRRSTHRAYKKFRIEVFDQDHDSTRT